MRLPAPDMATWGPEIRGAPGATWLGTEWFFAECYVYRCLMTAVRYWETGRDPFALPRSPNWQATNCGSASRSPATLRKEHPLISG